VTSIHFIGLDIHKKRISYCVKDVSGKVLSEGTVPATRIQLNEWMRTLPAPWTEAMEATMFTGWIYNHPLPHAAAVKVAHPLMLRAIAAAKHFLCTSPKAREPKGLRCSTQSAHNLEAMSAQTRKRAASFSGRSLIGANQRQSLLSSDAVTEN
jgi:transposase